jgi:regulation of enolase protein 1 (concanavalin A-like superfamily)
MAKNTDRIECLPSYSLSQEENMRRTGIYILILLALAALLGSLLTACGKGDKTPTPTPSAQASATATPTTTTGGGGQTPTATSTTAGGTSTPKPGGMPELADLDSLSSYRMSIATKMTEGMGAGMVTYMKYEYVKDKKAEHAWIEDASGQVTEVSIKIGDKYWIWMYSLGWIEQPPQTTPEPSAEPSDLASQLREAQEDVANSKARFDKKGEETVNNVHCIHYEFEYTLTIEMPNLATGGTTKTDMHSYGDVWIADQSGLPAVMIKSIGTSEITMAGEKTVMESEQNLTDIGAAITINPPEGATQPPTPTGLPTSLPTSTPTPTPTAIATPTPTTTSTATGGTLIFDEDFLQASWNYSWYWTDPNDDATYSLTSHIGFLRLTVPDNNDLAGVTNYDAPRLLIPRSGDFTIETLVEFNPQEVYQGAGLLVWQDEDTFLRLEFGYGGMGGADKNVVFVMQEYGGLALVNSVDVPETMTSIELRLQREGDEFIASYRQVGGTWQVIGSTILSLNPTVDVGITQVTQYTSSAISADFDYFKLFIP